MTPFTTRAQRIAKLEEIALSRILILDGAMGTMIQGYDLHEADFRGDRFVDHDMPLKGNNDLLVLTRPDIISEVHKSFLSAGADIISTNTFNATTISQADYGLQPLVYELNKEAARLARKVCDEFETSDAPKVVAGAIGPTNKTLSLSPDVNDPGFRAASFDEMSQAFREQAEGLLDGGADMLLVETIFDTLVAKAALYAIEALFEDRGERVPVMISGTITDRSGRTPVWADGGSLLEQRAPRQPVVDWLKLRAWPKRHAAFLASPVARGHV